MKQEVYPIGEQSFKEIRETGKVYIDKTSFIPLLLRNKYYFLSRPRRFGKSLLLSVLENFFLGRRKLFKSLAIDSYDWGWEEYPVIRINLGEGSYSKENGLETRLYEILEEYEARYGIHGAGDDPRARFRHLIIKLYEKFNKGVVILIDEYEKPLLDAMPKPFFDKVQDEMADFYSVLKNNDEKIKFLFLTGVTRFGHLNIFSGFNNIIDISLDDEYSDLCGISEDEMERYLRSGIERFAVSYDIDYLNAKARLKKYYDGYHFSRKLIDVYNPFSLLNCLSASRLTSRWFQTGSSRYLLERLRDNDFDITSLDSLKAGEETLLGIDSSMNDSVTLLYQSGYLTIKSYDPETNRYALGLPNYEVSTALFSAIIPYYLGRKYEGTDEDAYGFIEMLKTGKPYEAMEWLQGYFSSIPQDVKLNYESDFQQIIYAFFALCCQLAHTTLEKKTSNGRIDMVFTTEKFVYVFEFKRGEDARKALDQINDRQYALPWQADRRKVYKIGVAFSPKSRGISGFLIS